MVMAASLAIGWAAMSPFDPALFGHAPDVLSAITLWRKAAVAACAIAFAGIWWLAPRGFDLFAPALLIMTGCCALRGYTMALAGGLDTTVFYTGYFIPLFTVPMIWSHGRRVVATAFVTLAYLGAYFAVRPADLLHPDGRQTCAFELFGALMSVTVGAALYSLLQSNHAQRVELEARSKALEDRERELSEANDRLEVRVAERTEQLRKLTSHIEASREDERRRIAREIHDEMGQLLTALRMELDLARGRPCGEDGLPAILGRMDELVSQALDAARALVAELRPRVLDDLGLPAATEWYLERFAERSGIACAWEVELDGSELEADPAAAVFRVLQESLTNVAKHSSAREVQVTLRRVDGAVALEVSDDGVGIGREARSDGFGVLGMHERARAFGGELVIGPRQPSGTRLQLRMPRAQRVHADDERS